MGQNVVIISKSKSIEEAVFYSNKTIENNWSRWVLIPKEIKTELPTIEEIELATTKAIRKTGNSDK